MPPQDFPFLSRRPVSMFNSFHLARIAGIGIAVDWSLLVVFLLLFVSLGVGLFPIWHPDWSIGFNLLMAMVAALLFFASVLAHELAHALVGRLRGVPVERITLFIFGGVAHLEREPPTWRADLMISLVGPLTSFLITGLSLVGVKFVARDLPMDPAYPELFLTSLGPGGTLLLWLGQINLIIAIFNLIPGFPLDGGRVLRALLWGATGDLRRATRRAAQAGQVFSWLLMAAGIAMLLNIRVPLLGAGLINGMWVLMIGWFLHTAALMSYQRLLLGESLEDVPVSRVMQSRFESVGGDTPISELVDQYLLPGGQRAYPVVEGDGFVGLVCLPDVRKIPREDWPRVRVRDIMTPAAGLSGVGPDTSAADAMLTLGRQGVNQLPVLEDGRVRGLVSRENILKLLSLYGDPALAQ